MDVAASGANAAGNARAKKKTADYRLKYQHLRLDVDRIDIEYQEFINEAENE